MTDTPVTPTTVLDAAKRALRTLIQVGIPAFLVFALVLPQIIDALGLPVDSKVYLWLIGAAAFVTGVATAISRIMAIPAVNSWLTKLGLGAATPINPTAVASGPVVAQTPAAPSPPAAGAEPSQPFTDQ